MADLVLHLRVIFVLFAFSMMSKRCNLQIVRGHKFTAFYQLQNLDLHCVENWFVTFCVSISEGILQQQFSDIFVVWQTAQRLYFSACCFSSYRNLKCYCVLSVLLITLLGRKFLCCHFCTLEFHRKPGKAFDSSGQNKQFVVSLALYTDLFSIPFSFGIVM